MTMIRPKGKAYIIAKQVLKKQGVVIAPNKSNKKLNITLPYIQR